MRNPKPAPYKEAIMANTSKAGSRQETPDDLLRDAFFSVHNAIGIAEMMALADDGPSEIPEGTMSRAAFAIQGLLKQAEEAIEAVQTAHLQQKIKEAHHD